MSDRLVKDDADEPVETKPRPFWLRALPVILLLVGLAIAYGLGLHRYLSFDFLVDSRAFLADWVNDHAVTAPLLFVGVYVLAVALSLPAASVLSIFGGFLFGWLYGAALVAAGATIGATIIFLAARTVLGDTLRRKAGPRIASFARGFENDAFSYLLALRLAPIFPFFLVNVAPAFFKVPLATFVTATALGILPGVLAYTYLGAGLEEALRQAQLSGAPAGPGDLITGKIVIAFFALAVIALIPVAYRKLTAKRRSAQASLN